MSACQRSYLFHLIVPLPSTYFSVHNFYERWRGLNFLRSFIFVNFFDTRVSASGSPTGVRAFCPEINFFRSSRIEQNEVKITQTEPWKARKRCERRSRGIEHICSNLLGMKLSLWELAWKRPQDKPKLKLHYDLGPQTNNRSGSGTRQFFHCSNLDKSRFIQDPQTKSVTWIWYQISQITCNSEVGSTITFL